MIGIQTLLSLKHTESDETYNNYCNDKPGPMSSPPPSLDYLCDDALATTLSFLPYRSAVLFSKCISRHIASRVIGVATRNANTNIHEFSESCLHETSEINGHGTVPGRFPSRTTESKYAEIGDDEGGLAIIVMDVNDSDSDEEDKACNINRIDQCQIHDDRTCFQHVWKEIYARHHFAPEDDWTISMERSDGNGDGMRSCEHYIHLCQAKRQLLNRLLSPNCNKFATVTSAMSKRKSNTSWSCFSLPNRCFHFVPVQPQMNHVDNDDDVHDDEDDYPPVDFPCASYLLTSCSTGGEYAFLDPFDGSLSVYPNIMDSVVTTVTDSDSEGSEDVEGDLEKYMLQTFPFMNGGACSSTSTSNGEITHVVEEEDGRDEVDIVSSCHGMTYALENVPREHNSPLRISAASSSETTIPRVRNATSATNTKPEVLFSVHDYFQLDLNDYFVRLEDIQGRHRYQNYTQGRGNVFPPAVGDDEEVIVDWMGIDTHAMIDPESGDMRGTMICAARIISVDVGGRGAEGMLNIVHMGHPDAFMSIEEERACTEVLGWKKDRWNATYKDCHYKCRMDGSPYYIDVCAMKERVYACFYRGQEHSECDNAEGQANVLLSELLNNAAMNDGDRNREQVGMDIDNDSDDEGDDDDSFGMDYNRRIVVFPFVKDDQNFKSRKDANRGIGNDRQRQFFPRMQDSICCVYPVTCFIVEPTGNNIVVGTQSGGIEIWDTGASNGSNKLRQRISIASQIKKQSKRTSTPGSRSDKHECKCTGTSDTSLDSTLAGISDGDSIDNNTNYNHEGLFVANENDGMISYERRNSSYTNMAMEHIENIETARSIGEHDLVDDESSLPLEEQNQAEMDEVEHNIFSCCQCRPRRKVNQIILPRYLPIEKSGFFALQYHRNEGTTLSFWQKNTSSEYAGKFELSSLVNLPLSTQRKPQVSYDGKRLIVFGQDHIGLIILIYRVFSSPEDRDEFASTSEKSQEESTRSENSGGVIDLGGSNCIQYMNRIRHAGLGGMEYYDSMYMSHNERFIMVNTKTGNLVASNGKSSEGLLVIDLEA